mmetsp:Transcript_66711/g.159497  ORF Transcript_66711/g.159497 Transcript_66711/m.159497 type:complete len:207 (+) Transcript_66711:1369-1989(+)
MCWTKLRQHCTTTSLTIIASAHCTLQTEGDIEHALGHRRPVPKGGSLALYADALPAGGLVLDGDIDLPRNVVDVQPNPTKRSPVCVLNVRPELAIKCVQGGHCEVCKCPIRICVVNVHQVMPVEIFCWILHQRDGDIDQNVTVGLNLERISSGTLVAWHHLPRCLQLPRCLAIQGGMWLQSRVAASLFGQKHSGRIWGLLHGCKEQ